MLGWGLLCCSGHTWFVPSWSNFDLDSGFVALCLHVHLFLNPSRPPCTTGYTNYLCITLKALYKHNTGVLSPTECTWLLGKHAIYILRYFLAVLLPFTFITIYFVSPFIARHRRCLFATSTAFRWGQVLEQKSSQCQLTLEGSQTRALGW